MGNEELSTRQGNQVRTRDVEEPVGLPSINSDERRELDIARIQRLIPTAEGEDTTKLLSRGIWIPNESGKPETHFGCRQLTAVGERLPEWGGPGVGKSLEGKTKETGDRTTFEASSDLIDPQPRLGLNLETTHCHGVSDEVTGDRSRAI